MTTGLGILGGRPRGRRAARPRVFAGLGAAGSGTVIAYQLDMRTAGAQTRTDGVMDAAACNALAALLGDIRANPTSAAQDEVTHDAEIRIVNGAAAIQALCAAPSTAPASTSSGGSTASSSSTVPSPYWADARVKSAQTLLNAELAKAGCSTTLKADGLIGPGTCGALTWAVPRAGLSPDLIALVRANAAPFGSACSKVTPTAPKCPAAPAPAPYVPPAPVPAPAPAPTPAVDGKALMVQLQGLLNQALARYGYKLIPVSGKWDAATCGAGATVNPLLPLGDSLRSQIGSQTAQVIAALGKPCGVTIAGLAPTRVPAPAAAPAPAKPAAKPVAAPAPVPAKPAVDPCYIEFGTRNAVVAEMQAELNRLLDTNGYKPIRVSGQWDAASCGALFVLGGQFDPYIETCKGGSWSVPASCPQKILPVKKAAPPPPAPVKSASMLGYGILAAIGLAGAVYAKKKGLLG